MKTLPNPPRRRNLHHRDAASLSHLPPEVKGLIVEWVVEEWVVLHSPKQQYSETDGPAWTARGEDITEDDRMEYSGGPYMQAVSLVSREFATLAQPYLWRAVNLSDWNVEGLIYFVNTILPRHGCHIKSLGAVQDTGTGRRTRKYVSSDVDMLAQTILGEAVAPPACEGEALLAYLRQQTLLVARAIEGMPNLVKFSSNVPVLPQDDIAAKAAVRGHGPEAPEWSREQVVLALAALGRQLAHLHLSSPRCDWGNYDEHTLATVLPHFPFLRRLTLWLRPDSLPGDDYLIPSISSLQHLRDLEIRDDSDFVSDRFAAATWGCPLETLALEGCQALSVPSLVKLLANFSDTLTTLKLDIRVWNVDEQTRLDTPFLLPHLETLALDINLPAPFLSSFVNCPLQFITIGGSGYLGKSAWKPFILSHARTLKRVTVGATADHLTAEAMRDLWRYCDTCEVEFRVEKWLLQYSDSASALGRESPTAWEWDADEDLEDAGADADGSARLREEESGSEARLADDANSSEDEDERDGAGTREQDNQ